MAGLLGPGRRVHKWLRGAAVFGVAASLGSADGCDMGEAPGATKRHEPVGGIARMTCNRDDA